MLGASRCRAPCQTRNSTALKIALVLAYPKKGRFDVRDGWREANPFLSQGGMQERFVRSFRACDDAIRPGSPNVAQLKLDTK